MDYQIKTLPIDKLKVNEGQIEGLPKNPRLIKDERFRALVKSIREAPEMLNLRELIVVEHDGEYIVIGGNMRLRASQELGLKELPCKILPSDTPADKLREYTIKDNNGFGENDWDLLANEWDVNELESWGTELPTYWNEDDEMPDNFDEEKEDKDFVVKLTFATEKKIKSFLLKYKTLIMNEFDCFLSVGGGKL